MPRGRFCVPVLLAALLSCTGDSPTNSGSTPAQLQAVSGSGQTGTVGTSLVAPLVVRVTDAKGRAVKGQRIEWSADGGGTLVPASGMTDAAGEARTQWTLGTTAGSLTASATVQGLPAVQFSASAGADAPASVKVSGGDGQEAVVGTPASSTPTVKVADRYGNPVQGVDVAWAVTAGGGTVTPPTSRTDATGSASTEWTLGRTTGAQTLTATVGAAGASTFTATASPPAAPAKVERLGGDAQTGTAGQALADSLAVRVLSADGKPVPWATVTWAAAEGTVSSSSGTTDRNGISKVSWTLGGAAGVQGAEARVPGLAGSPVAFRATAGAGSPAKLTKTLGDGQKGTVGLELLVPLMVQVSDRYGNVVSGARVAWAAGAGGSITPENSSSTYSSGNAVAQWKLGPGEGIQKATATLGDVSVEFTATAGPWAPVASISLGSGDLTMAEGRAFGVLATLRDAQGNTLSGRTVTWSTSAPTVASVSSTGPTHVTVLPLAVGKSVITATAEGKSASLTLTVTTAPRLTGFSRTPATVDVTSASASVEFSVSATDAGAGVGTVIVGLAAPAQNAGAGCIANSPTSGTPADGVWRCTATIPRGAVAGTWTVGQLTLLGRDGAERYYNSGHLGSAGYPWTVIVNNSGPPATRPTVTGLSISPTTVDITHANAVVNFMVTAMASAGIRNVTVSVNAVSGGGGYGCRDATFVSGTPENGTWKVVCELPMTVNTGTWTINTVGLSDHAGNSRGYSGADLANAGFPSTFQITRGGSSVAPASTTRPRQAPRLRS